MYQVLVNIFLFSRDHIYFSCILPPFQVRSAYSKVFPYRLFLDGNRSESETGVISRNRHCIVNIGDMNVPVRRWGIPT
jgi:hypothetical protein